MGKISKKNIYIYVCIYVFSPRGTSSYTFYVEHKYINTEEELASIAGSAAQQKAMAA